MLLAQEIRIRLDCRPKLVPATNADYALQFPSRVSIVCLRKLLDQRVADDGVKVSVGRIQSAIRRKDVG